MDFSRKMIQKIKEKKDAIAQSQVSLLNKFKTSPEIQKERMDICLSCDKLYKPTGSCKVCGCFMQLKTWMPDQRCPLGKWVEAESMESIEDQKHNG